MKSVHDNKFIHSKEGGRGKASEKRDEGTKGYIGRVEKIWKEQEKEAE